MTAERKAQAIYVASQIVEQEDFFGKDTPHALDANERACYKGGFYEAFQRATERGDDHAIGFIDWFLKFLSKTALTPISDGVWGNYLTGKTETAESLFNQYCKEKDPDLPKYRSNFLPA